MRTWTVANVARLMVRNRDRGLCPDGVVRLDIDAEAKECVEECVRRVNDGGLMCADWYPLPGDKKLRVAVYPKTLELPKPQWSARYETQEEARAAVQQERIQHPARYVRGMEAKAGGFVVESWEPWDYLRQEMYPCWTVEEIVGAHVDYGAGGADHEFRQVTARKSGTKSGKIKAAQRRAEQRRLFEILRKKYPVALHNKGGLITDICKKGKGQTGWKFSAVKANLKGLK